MLLCGVNNLASYSLRGHWNLPDSSRLYSSRNPLLSQYSALILPASATEQKTRVGKQIQLKLLLNDVGQTCGFPFEVGVAAGDIELCRLR